MSSPVLKKISGIWKMMIRPWWHCRQVTMQYIQHTYIMFANDFEIWCSPGFLLIFFLYQVPLHPGWNVYTYLLKLSLWWLFHDSDICWLFGFINKLFCSSALYTRISIALNNDSALTKTIFQKIGIMGY